MNHQINRLIHFGLQHHLISEDDEIYAVNLLLDLFHLDHFTKEDINEELEVATDILEEMLDYACQEGFIENNITERLHRIILEKQEQIKIFVLNNFINMEILKLPLIYLNQKKIQKKS